MYCRICGCQDVKINLLGQNVCKKCLGEITRITPFDDRYIYYKNMIRIIFAYYVSW